jgi:hypothetical protein
LINEKDIPNPLEDAFQLSSLDAISGPPVSPTERLRLMNDKSWEEFTNELASVWKIEYLHVNRCGGGGDKGRDVIAYTPNDKWENFQCKFYKEAINLTDAILEIGKLLYFVFIGEYSMPERYTFIAPHGVNVALLNCLMDVSKLKDELVKRWDKVCLKKITSTKPIKLEGKFKDFILNRVDFSIFDQIPPLKLIELHSRTNYHVRTFGAGHVKRPKAILPPDLIHSSELVYISELYRAIESEIGHKIDFNKLLSLPEYLVEFKSARKNFYSTDSLERFSRDSMPKGTFDDLLEECHEAISSLLMMKHDNGWQKYLAASNQIAYTSFEYHPLHYYFTVKDKKGTCHKLVNNNQFQWVNK